MAFLGRTEELKKLKDFYSGKNASMALIYGRRRVGKSELIKESIKNLKNECIYLECKQTSEENNLMALKEVLKGFKEIKVNEFISFEQAIKYLYLESKKRTIVLILDEYSFLSDVISGIDSILQVLYDEYHKESKLKIVLCGSYVNSMKNVLEADKPLYGRINLTMYLKPMNYLDSSLFYDTFSNEDKVKLYSVFGGIPYYNSLIDKKKSVKNNIIDLIASKNSRLENEVLYYMKTEISKMAYANEVFETLARGYTKFTDILSNSHLPNSQTLSEVLNKLVNMEVVKKVVPINDENNKKKAGYYISDNLCLFYYKYIYRNLSKLSIMSDKDFYKIYIEKEFETNYVPKAFEDICKQYLVSMNLSMKIRPPFEKIGKYYYDLPKEKKNGEFDIVTLDSKGYVFYEVKFRNKKIDEKLILKEIEEVNNARLKCHKYGFFSKSGYEKLNIKNVDTYTLDDVYKIQKGKRQ